MQKCEWIFSAFSHNITYNYPYYNKVMHTKRCCGHVCRMSACMTAGVRKTSFVSEIKRSSIGSRHANIIGLHRDPLEVTIFQFVVRNMC